MRHFLSLRDFSRTTLWSILNRANELKSARRRGERLNSLTGKILAMLFEKPSTRTRVSFEVGIKELGGDVIFLGANEVGLGKREAVKDVSRTLSRYVHGVIIRTFSHDRLLEFADCSSVPVVNALTDLLHPCQALSDVFTVWERFPVLEDIRVLFIGDGNNVLHSLLFASAQFGFSLVVLTPKDYRPSPIILAEAEELAIKNFSRTSIHLISSVEEIRKVDVVYTDVWVSMGQEKQRDVKLRDFKGFQVNESLLEKIGNPWVMHCLPAHRGEEVTDSVLDGARSIVFDQAENRLHVQKAILEWLWK